MKETDGSRAAENPWWAGGKAVSEVGRGGWAVGLGRAGLGWPGRSGRRHWAGPGRGHGLVGPGRAWDLDFPHWR